MVTPTPREARLEDIERRRRRYLWLIGPALALTAFGFFVPAPTAVRLGALIVAATLAPVAGIVANNRTPPRR